jgi:hypothetical protein
MTDHSGVRVSEFARAKACYRAALAPIGSLVLDRDGHDIEVVCHEREPARGALD